MKIKRTLISFLGLALVATIVGCGNPNKKETYKPLKLESYNDTLNWVYGYLIAQNIFGPMKEVTEEDFQPGHMMKGALDKLEENELLDQKAIQAFLASHSEKVKERIKKEQEKESEENIKTGGTFLDENEKKEGVTATESGLQYEVLKKASGKKPVDGDKVSVHYHGTLLDGTVFDSSVDRGQPAEFGLNQVIKGWQEGLKLMSVGSKFKFYIPSELAYGKNRVGNIPGSSVLVFEVELLEIL